MRRAASGVQDSGGAALVHGSRQLPSVIVDGYSADIKDRNGYFGDKASNGTFQQLLQNIRREMKETGGDPIEVPAKELSKKIIDRLLLDGDFDEAGVILSAMEQFSQNLATVAIQLLRTKEWAEVERIVVGGGFRQSRVGELVIGRAQAIVRTSNKKVELRPIRHDSDEAGLLGSIHLVPGWMLAGYDCLLGVDIGGSNFRCGLIELNQQEASDFSRAAVVKLLRWRHVEEQPERDEATQNLGAMIAEIVAFALKKKRRVAPLIGVGCPGTILEDGSLEGGFLNLPGDWGEDNFNLVERIHDIVPKIGEHDSVVVLHNDAVVQGLSEVPFMQDVAQWGVLTVGTGLGNASFRNRKRPSNAP
jgi:hypothetical protein